MHHKIRGYEAILKWLQTEFLYYQSERVKEEIMVMGEHGDKKKTVTQLCVSFKTRLIF